MHTRTVSGTTLLGILIGFSSATAQATGDQARLTLGITGGVVGGRDLWSVGLQPVQLTFQADTFDLGRRIRSTLSIGFNGTYFTGDYLGFGAEGFLIGLGYEDRCRQVFSTGSLDAAAVCRSIQGSEKPASSVALSVGPILRVNSRKTISPYGRVNLGFVISTQSSIRTIGSFPTDSGLANLIVYSDDRDTRLEPSLALGIGFTVQVGKGYGLRWEIRDNITAVQRVTRTTSATGTIPPHERVFKHLFSITAGFDVILERKRGRRY